HCPREDKNGNPAAGPAGERCGCTRARRICAVAQGAAHRNPAFRKLEESPSIQREPFERGLRELGWHPGSNIVLDYRYAEGDAAKLAAIASELVRSGADVIVARANNAIAAARKASS